MNQRPTMLQFLLVQEFGRIVSCSSSCNTQERVPVDASHLHRFCQPVLHRVLDDAEGVNPDIRNVKPSREHDSVPVHTGKVITLDRLDSIEGLTVDTELESHCSFGSMIR